MKGNAHRAFFVSPRSPHEDQIALVHLAVPQLCMQRSQRRASLRDEQNSGRLPVQAMDELEKRRTWPRRAQLLDQPHGNATASVNGQSRRLVDREQRVVLE